MPIFIRSKLLYVITEHYKTHIVIKRNEDFIFLSYLIKSVQFLKIPDWYYSILLYFCYSGLVVGLLKIGRKSLYVFDKFGDTKHVLAPCVLDFYIHETRQRSGLGKVLFEYMLDYENLLPEQLAIDRPSEKLLSFLRKHYGKKFDLLVTKRKDFLFLTNKLIIYSIDPKDSSNE